MFYTHLYLVSFWCLLYCGVSRTAVLPKIIILYVYILYYTNGTSQSELDNQTQLSLEPAVNPESKHIHGYWNSEVTRRQPMAADLR